MGLRKHYRRTAKVGADCVACDCYVRVCPFSAVQIWSGIAARVDTDRCVGCSKCAVERPAAVITLGESCL